MRRLIGACIVVVAVVTVTSIPTAADARRRPSRRRWMAGGWPGPGVGLRRSHEGNPGGALPY
jgi:hypothetical protein